MSALPRNIQVFDHIAAVILVRLYENFPSPIDLPCATIGADVAEQVDAQEEEAFDLVTNKVSDSIAWLRNEGYLTVTTSDGGFSPTTQYFGVVLTSKGVSVLGQQASPKFLAEPASREDWGTRLRRALADKSPEMVVDAIGLVLRAGGAG